MSKTYAPHQLRVIQEQEELIAKRDALTTFILREDNELFKSLSVREQSLLEAQRSAMNAYSEILGKRIEEFGEPNYVEPVFCKEDAVKRVKGFRKDLDEVLQKMKHFKMILGYAIAIPDQTVAEEPHEAVAQLTISQREAESSIMRLGMTLKAVGNPTPYPDSFNPENSKVAPTADGLKL